MYFGAGGEVSEAERDIDTHPHLNLRPANDALEQANPVHRAELLRLFAAHQPPAETSREPGVTVKGRVPVIREAEEGEWWIGEQGTVAEFYRDGIWRSESGYGTDYWPTYEAAARFIAAHADAPAPLPAAEAGRELPDGPGVWHRDRVPNEAPTFDIIVKANPFEPTNELLWAGFGGLNLGRLHELPRGHWHRAPPADQSLRAENESLRKRLQATRDALAVASTDAENSLREQLAAVERELPATFYADRDLPTRVKFLVAAWRKLHEAVEAERQRAEGLRGERDEAKRQLAECEAQANDHGLQCREIVAEAIRQGAETEVRAEKAEARIAELERAGGEVEIIEGDDRPMPVGAWFECDDHVERRGDVRRFDLYLQERDTDYRFLPGCRYIDAEKLFAVPVPAQPAKGAK